MSTPPDSHSPQTPPAEHGLQCAACKVPLGDSYYQANDAVLCESCATSLQQSQAPQGSRLVRLMKALVLGLLAAAAGATIQFLVIKYLNINAALVTILIGFMVGGATRFGSGGRGGWRYQIIAIVLTYLAIGAAYVPIAVAELKTSHERKEAGLPDPAFNKDKFKAKRVVPGTPAPVAVPTEEPGEPLPLPAIILAVLSLIFVLPVSIGMSSPFSIVIFGFGLYQAWKMNKATPIAITGPFWRNQPALPA